MEVKGYPKYLIYDDGRLYDKLKKQDVKKYNDKDGYELVCLCRSPNNWDMKRFHRLLAEHFIPNPHNYPHIDHKNKITNDNRLCNLRWVSLSVNNINRKSNNKYRNITFIKTQNIGTSYRFSFKRNKKVVINKTFRNFNECCWFKFVFTLLKS